MANRVTKDILWKGILEDCFEDFFRYFYPEWADDIDFSKGVEFLDKELDQLMPEAANSKRYVDKLAKVYLKSGEQQWILIHIEVQGYKDKDFPKRMFTYFYRIFDRHGRPIHAVAILVDPYKDFHPRAFEYNFLKTKLSYQFDTYKLLDMEQEEFSKQPENPFSIVLETVWGSLKKKGDKNLLNLKLRVARRLLKSGISRKKVERILNFIRFHTDFKNRENTLKFETMIDEITENKGPMGINERIMEALREQAIEEGLKEGLEKGLEKGMEKGMEKGLEKGMEIALKESIARLLRKGYSPEQVTDMLDVEAEIVAEVLENLDNGNGQKP